MAEAITPSLNGTMAVWIARRFSGGVSMTDMSRMPARDICSVRGIGVALHGHVLGQRRARVRHRAGPLVRQDVREGVVDVVLPRGVARDSMPARRGARGLENEEIARHQVHRAPDLVHRALPTGAAET